jgi:transcriptional regulator with XRE-family HTH domain
MSYQITISPNKRAAARFVALVRRSLQRALAEEEKKRGLSQSDLARAIGVNRSVISREMRGHKDLPLSRVAELAWAMGRKPIFDLIERAVPVGSNVAPDSSGATANQTIEVDAPPLAETETSNTAITFAQAA